MTRDEDAVNAANHLILQYGENAESVAREAREGALHQGHTYVADQWELTLSKIGTQRELAEALRKRPQAPI